MASCKVIRRLALLHNARGFCYKQDVVYQPRSSLQLLAALEEHTSSSGKELLASLKNLVFWEKEMAQREKDEKETILAAKERERDEKEKILAAKKELLASKEELLASKEELLASKEETLQLLREQRSTIFIKLLKLEGLNDTCGLFERMQEVLAAYAGNPATKGFPLWEAILKAEKTLSDCIELNTKIKDVVKQAVQCHTIYIVLSQAGKELAQLQAAKGKILFHRGPMSPKQVKIFECIGKAASFTIEEDPSTRLGGEPRAAIEEGQVDSNA